MTISDRTTIISDSHMEDTTLCTEITNGSHDSYPPKISSLHSSGLEMLSDPQLQTEFNAVRPAVFHHGLAA